MWRGLASTEILLVVGLLLLSCELGCYRNKETGGVSSNLDEEPMTARQDNHAGRDLFLPDKYLVHARATSVRRDVLVECSQLRIEHVYVGQRSLKGRIFDAFRYYRRGFTSSIVEIVSEQNPPIEIGEIGIWWVTRSAYKGYLVADFGVDLAIVGGCEPSRQGISSNSRRHCYYSYEDALEYAALWEKMYNASDTDSQMAILRQAVVSHNPIISDGAFELLFARRPPGFLNCLKELTVDPNVPVNKLKVIKDFVDGVEKKKIKEKEMLEMPLN
jgi:hypothetical protein